jgi:hypothetical protein
VGEPRHRSLLSQVDLEDLLAEVVRTRNAQQEAQRQRGATTEALRPARLSALAALEAYAGALDRHGWPMPPRMRFDIQLLRSLCGRDGPRL